MEPPHEITRLLQRWSAGEEGALAQLTPLVYTELKRIAYSLQGGATMNPTAIVNEFYIRLDGVRAGKWDDRKQFYGLAATVMRRVVVDYARERQAQKRGGRSTVEELFPDSAVFHPDPEIQIALDTALNALEALHAQKARIVELRYFTGLSIEETAEALGISAATVKRDWAFSKIWLYNAMTGRPKPERP
jgi:RNA polymerase sigma-70 factor, ECF subfamily